MEKNFISLEFSRGIFEKAEGNARLILVIINKNRGCNLFITPKYENIFQNCLKTLAIGADLCYSYIIESAAVRRF